MLSALFRAIPVISICPLLVANHRVALVCLSTHPLPHLVLMRNLVSLILKSDPAKQEKIQSLWTWNTEMVINLLSKHSCQTLTSPHTFFISQKTSGMQLPSFLSTCCPIPSPTSCLLFFLFGEENTKSKMRMSMSQKPGVATLDSHYSIVREDR